MFSGVCFMDNINDLGENRLRFCVKDVKCVDYLGMKCYEFVCEYNNSIKYWRKILFKRISIYYIYIILNWNY